MTDKDRALPPLEDRAVVNGAQEVSALRVSVPSAGDWVVFRNSSHDPVSVEIKQATKVTPSLVKFAGGYPRQTHILSIVAHAATKDGAERIRDAINGVAGEFHRRRRSAEDERSRRITEALAAANRHVERIVAQGMSAGTAKTAQPVEGEAPQARPEGCAQTPPGGSND